MAAERRDKRAIYSTGLAETDPERGNLRIEVLFRDSVSKAVLRQCEQIIEKWNVCVTEVGVAGEFLRYSHRETYPRDNAVVLDFENYEPVTFPWIELYLRLRMGIKRSSWPIGQLYSGYFR